MRGVPMNMMIAVASSLMVGHAVARERPHRRTCASHPGKPRHGH